MKTSLAMTTYNGEKYILRQLESLRLQTRTIDEVIICDDCSFDSTAKIIEEYIDNNNLDNWFLTINESNLGFVENFKNAVGRTSGDIIFLCDQDDEWDTDKVELMTTKLEQNEWIELLACSLRFINEDSAPCVPNRIPDWYRSMVSKQFLAMELIDFLDICPSNFSPGCTMCFTRRIANEYLKHESRCLIPHDWLISLIAASKNAFCFINTPLINYRIHSNNAIGVKSADKSKSAVEQIERMERLRCRYEIALESTYTDIEQVRNNIEYVSDRIEFYKKRTPASLMKVWRVSSNVKGVYRNQFLINIKDLLYVLHMVF